VETVATENSLCLFAFSIEKRKFVDTERAPLSEVQIEAIKASIERRATELEESYMNVLIQAGPVYQCADAMKKSIDDILETIQADQFEKAASLGYRDFAANFIWMQRSLGGMNDAAMKCSEVVSLVALDCHMAFEQVYPLVKEFFARSRRPKEDSQTEIEQQQNREAILKRIGGLGQTE
jgi:hypothetical protein